MLAGLQAVVESSAQRLLNLATQWEKHRAPLIDQYRKLRQLSSQREVSILIIYLDFLREWLNDDCPIYMLEAHMPIHICMHTCTFPLSLSRLYRQSGGSTVTPIQ